MYFSIGISASEPDIRFNYLGVWSSFANLVIFFAHIVFTLLDFLAPPMYDVSNNDMWKFKMSAYLKTLGLHVYLTATKKSYIDNVKYLEANNKHCMYLGKHLAKIIYLLFLIVISLL